jgi:hypothetical protein
MPPSRPQPSARERLLLDTHTPLSNAISESDQRIVDTYLLQPSPAVSVQTLEPVSSPKPYWMVHYSMVGDAGDTPVKYRLKYNDAARRFKEASGVADGWEDFGGERPCDPWHCHNKNHVPSQSHKKNKVYTDGQPHANTKYARCCNEVKGRGRANCDPCTVRLRRKRFRPTTSTSNEPAVEVIARPPPLIQPAAVLERRGGYRAHKNVLPQVQGSVSVLYYLCTILPWRDQCATGEFTRRDYGENPYYDEARHANFDVRWPLPKPQSLNTTAKRMKDHLKAAVKRQKIPQRLSHWVHPYSNSVPSQQRFIMRAPPEMLQLLRKQEHDYANLCDLTEVLPKLAEDALKEIILALGLVLCGGKTPEYPCDIAELLGAHPLAIRQSWHSDTLGRIRRMNTIARLTSDGHGSYKGTLLFTHRNYTYHQGAVDDLVGAMQDDWDSGGDGLGDDAIYRVDLDTGDVLEIMSDMIHAGPGNPSDTWRFMLFLSWPLSSDKGDLESDIGTYGAWKKFFAQHSTR